MNQEIWKFPINLDELDADSHIQIAMPRGARVLYATSQYSDVVLYALVHPGQNNLGSCDVWVFGTGQPIRGLEKTEAVPMGVVRLAAESVMLHVFATRVVRS